MTRGKVKRALVLCPKILIEQWCQELGNKFRIEARHAVGVELGQLARDKCPVVVTTYDSARTRMSELERSGFNMLVLDEAHKLRNLYGTDEPPRRAVAVQQALQHRVFRYVLMLTATPIQNRLWDLYSLIDLLTTAKGHVNPLGKADEFASRYVADSKGTARQLKPGQRDEFRHILAQYMVRTRRADCDLPFPQRRVLTEHAEGAQGEEELIRLVGSEIGHLNALTQTSLAQALMSSPQALVAQLDNMALHGTVDRTVHARAKQIATTLGRTGKERRLLELVAALQRERPVDWRAVVFTGRIETQSAIGAILVAKYGSQAVGYIRGSQSISNQRAIKEYTASPPGVHVLISTDAGAEGVNLQAGNVIVNYDLPWNPMVLEQRIGRVQRLGSEHKNVTVLNLVLRGSVEEHVVGRLSEKLGVIASTLGDIEGILESIPGSDGDEEAFEKKIREMVVASLEGRDVEGSVRRVQQNIERAKAVYEEEKRTVEDQLGRLDAMHREGPRLPELSKVAPRLDERSFTIHALEAEGGRLAARPEGGYDLVRQGRGPEIVVFDERVQGSTEWQGWAGGIPERIYRAGQPAFEQLVGRWSARSQHFTKDLRVGDETTIRELADSWARSYPSVRIRTIEVQTIAREFVGRLTMRAGASVAHDKYEKLIECSVVSEGFGDAEAPEENAFEPAHLLKEMQPEELGEGLEELVRSGVTADKDICAFSGFYLARMNEEVSSAQERPDLARLATDQFCPQVFTSVVGLRGHRFDRARLNISFTVAGQGSYLAVLEGWPSIGRIGSGPAAGRCSVTGHVVPDTALGLCEITEAMVLSHLLGDSERSGRKALREHLVRCEVTGKQLLSTETERSHASGKLVDSELLQACAVTGNRALAEELGTCEFTGTRVLPDELRASEVSGKRYRADQERQGAGRPVKGHTSEFARCEVSGKYFLPDELGMSDRSFKLVQLALLERSARAPHRMGLQEEMRTCEVTGAKLLVDETERCSVSGKTVDRALLEASEVSGRCALPDHFVTCEQTGKRVLSSESAKCAVTGSVVDARLLEASQASGALALRSVLVPCAVTGKRVLPQELVSCEVTSLKVLPDCLERCAITGTRAIDREMVRCAATDRRILRSRSVVSAASGRSCGDDIAQICSWDRRHRLPSEMGSCALTGVRVGLEHLDQDGYLSPLAGLLHAGTNGQRSGPSTHSAALASEGLARPLKLEDLVEVLGPNESSSAVVGTIRDMLGLRVRYVGMFLELKDFWKRVGKAAIGRRKHGRWVWDPRGLD